MKQIFTLLALLVTTVVNAQELFPIEEPASTVPKGALGVRIFAEGYDESNLVRSLMALRVMYGLTSKLSVYATADVSDYHEKTLPFDFITHHSGGVAAGTNTPAQGVPYPLVFNSADVYAKYRFLTTDGTNSHFRMAAYAEGSDVAVPSHEAEPDLLIHTSGWGAGLISTYLKKHFAASVTCGFIMPEEYHGNVYDAYGGIYPTTIQYGKAVNYDLSFGYLLIPKNYSNYEQTNWNVYCEFIGKSYQAAKVYQQNGPFAGAIIEEVPITTPILQAGHYVDIAPGIQCVLRSTYRIDFSVEMPLVNQSYNHLYPLYLLGAQRYIFFKKHSSADND